MRTILGSLAMIGLPTLVHSQVERRPSIADSSPARIMAHVGAKPNVPLVRHVLRQSDRQYDRAKLDAIADSLAARAIAAGRGSIDAKSTARGVDATGAIALAGSRAQLEGHPYPGAFDRLVAIHQQAATKAVRQRALAGLLDLPDRAPALSYLARVAVADDSTAYDAVEFLVADAAGRSWGSVQSTEAQREQTVDLLKRLATEAQPRKSEAARALQAWYAAYRSRNP